jgi:hypothetical protein
MFLSKTFFPIGKVMGKTIIKFQIYNPNLKNNNNQTTNQPNKQTKKKKQKHTRTVNILL